MIYYRYLQNRFTLLGMAGFLTAPPDHVGYEINPRRRDMGYHNIFDHYQQIVKEFNISQDTINWHFHPMSTIRKLTDVLLRC